MITLHIDINQMLHYSDVIMSAMASQITGVSIVYSTECSSADQRKHQNSPSLAFVRGIHRWPANSPHKGPVTRKMFPFDDVITIAFDWGTYQMADITYSNLFPCKKFCVLKLLLTFTPKGPRDNKSVLVQVTVWCRTGEKTFTWTNDDPFQWRINAALMC